MIELRGVSKKFGPLCAVDAAGLVLREGERVTLTGPSGCGKTTLLRLIAGLETPDAGEIRIGGNLVSRPGWTLAPHLRGIGFVFQEPALWPHMTVAANVRFALRGSPNGLPQLLREAGIAALAGRYPDQLSGGQARRVALARALAASPSCLLLDEPLAHLDGESKACQMELILRAGVTTILVTHDEREAASLGGRILFMRHGRLQPEN